MSRLWFFAAKNIIIRLIYLLPKETQMALVSMRQLLDHAAENSYGLPAFNVNNLEQMRAIMEAADQVARPSSYRRVQVRANMRARRFCAT